MRLIVVALLCVALLAPVSRAQTSALGPQMLIPSPLGVVLTLGQWLLFSDNKKIYYIEVAGRGDTAEQARNNGFRLAVEQALGTLVSSETEVQNGRIARDEIISYAAGYVDRFTIVSTEQAGNRVEVVMKVWVGRSALADRLLNRSEKSGEVDGARATVQLQTINHERVTGDALLQQVLSDFPKRAFDIDLKPTDILRQNRSAIVEVNFKLSWNKDYLRSMWAALEATGQRTSRPTTTIIVNGGGWFGGFGGAAKYDDNHKYDLIANRMYVQAPTVMVTIRGPGREVLFSSCYLYQELDNMAQYNVTTQRFVEFGHGVVRLNGHYTMPGRIQIPVGPEVLSRANSVDMDIVLRKQCPNR
jgi:hypothetical protein